MTHRAANPIRRVSIRYKEGKRCLDYLGFQKYQSDLLQYVSVFPAVFECVSNMPDGLAALSELYSARHVLIDPDWVVSVNIKIALGLIEVVSPSRPTRKSFRGNGLAFIRAFFGEEFAPLATSTPLPATPWGSCDCLADIADISPIAHDLFEWCEMQGYFASEPKDIAIRLQHREYRELML